MKWTERKRKQMIQARTPKYTIQYKIQYIIPNTFTNKESVAQWDSLHNQLKSYLRPLNWCDLNLQQVTVGHCRFCPEIQTSCRSKRFGRLCGGSATAETPRSHSFGRKQLDLKFRTILKYEVIFCFSFFSFFSFFVVWFCSKVCLSSLVCRMGLHPTLPGPGLPNQFCTTMTRCIDIKQLAHHPVAAQGQEVGRLRWSHRLHLRPPPANQQPIYLQSQQSNQSPWASCFVQ